MDEEVKERVWQFGESNYCIDCVANVVDLGIRNGAAPWPILLEGYAIDIEYFQHHLPQVLVNRYRRDDEWRSIGDPYLRVWCKHRRANGEGEPDSDNERPVHCNAFVGRRRSWAENDRHTMRECDDCRSQTCLRCARLNDGSASADPEQFCTQTTAMIEYEAARRDRAEGRGSEYQICPNENCSREVGLGAGCVSPIHVA